jgi:conjugative transposon TraM protein
MERQVKTPKMIRQQKFMLALPLLALPFITLMFWALGGGKMEEAKGEIKAQTGFNNKLPDANLKEAKQKDKMGYYDQALIDSLKFDELVRNDPNYNTGTQGDSMSYGQPTANGFQSSVNKGLNTSIYNNGSHNDPNSEMIYRKLAQLNQELQRPASAGSERQEADNSPYGNRQNTSASVNRQDIDRLQAMMQSMGQSEGEDPEMQQLNGMLEKIIDIQNPGRVQEKMKKNSDLKRGQIYAVQGNKKDVKISLLDDTVSNSQNGFYSLTEDVADETQNAIQAVVHQTQTIIEGSTVKLRLVDDVVINGTTIPKDNFAFGIASLKGERLGIEIKSIRYKNSLFPIELSVFDMDGLDGIYIPGAITRDVAKQSADRSMQNIGMNSLDPSFGAQAADAGIEAAKSLFSKKIKLVKVTVKAGYQVLLRDEKQKPNQSN